MDNPTPQTLYSIFPLYGDASVIVITADNLRDAVEKAFGVRLISIQDVLLDLEESEQYSDICAFYGVMSALGKRADSYSVLCSSTVITYTTTKARIARDLASVAGLKPARFAA